VFNQRALYAIDYQLWLLTLGNISLVYSGVVLAVASWILGSVLPSDLRQIARGIWKRDSQRFAYRRSQFRKKSRHYNAFTEVSLAADGKSG